MTVSKDSKAIHRASYTDSSCKKTKETKTQNVDTCLLSDDKSRYFEWHLTTSPAAALPFAEPSQHCEADKKTAPVAIDITNEYVGPVKIRACSKYDPVSGAACTGNMAKKNHYNDCPALLAVKTRNKIFIDADTQYVLFGGSGGGTGPLSDQTTNLLERCQTFIINPYQHLDERG